MKSTIVEEALPCGEGTEYFQLFPINSKTIRGKKLLYRATPATRTILAFSMLVLVCLGGVVMHHTVGDRRRLSGDDVTSKIECDNELDRIPALAVILYGICLIVLFIGLANITDDFFVPALTVTGKRLKLSEDVTGATLMASGSSAPELFTSSVDTFLHGTSIGIGTVVGSAVFNILVIIACSGAWATNSLVIDWKPFTRDCTFYCLSIVLLVVMLEWDGDKVGRIWWWEGLVMFLCYGFYVLIMAYNQSLMSCMARCAGEDDESSNEERDLQSWKDLFPGTVGALIIFDPKDCCTAKTFQHFEPLAREISGVNKVSYDIEQLMFCVEFDANSDPTKHKVVLKGFAQQAVVKAGNIEAMGAQPKVECILPGPLCDKSECADREQGSQLPFCFVFRWLEALANFFADGWSVVFKHIPDVNTEDLEEELNNKPDDKDLLKDIKRKEKGYQCTFFLSILWIGVICIFMVELAERIGCLLGINSLFMGLTVLAAGTSVPDALGSIASAKRGMGDMAVANAIGSNVFDIMIGLGLPWFLRGVIFNEEYTVEVKDLIVFIGILFSTVLITLVAFCITRWKLGPTLGKILLAAYFGFLLFAFVYVYLLD